MSLARKIGLVFFVRAPGVEVGGFLFIYFIKLRPTVLNRYKQKLDIKKSIDVRLKNLQSSLQVFEY